MIQDIFSRLKQKAKEAITSLDNQARTELQQYNTLRQAGVTTPVASPMIGRAIATDLYPKLTQHLNKIPSSITPFTHLINKITGRGVGDILQSAASFVVPPYSPEEQAYFRKLRTGEPFTPEDIKTAKNLSTEHILDIGLFFVGATRAAKPIQKTLFKSLSKKPTVKSVEQILNTGLPAGATKTANPIQQTLFESLSKKPTVKSVEQILNTGLPAGATKTANPIQQTLFESLSKEPAVENIVQKPLKKLPTKTKEEVFFGEPIDWYTRLVSQPRDKFKKLFGSSWDTIASPVFDAFEKNKGAMIDFKSSLAKKIQSSVPFSAGSRESRLIQMFGEGLLSKEDLIKKVGKEKAEKIVLADSEIRKIYDKALLKINELRRNAGLPEIPRRKDYYRHMQESSGLSDFLESLVSGGTRKEMGKSIMKRRKGNKTIYDAVGGLKNWIDHAGYAGFIEPSSIEFEKLLKKSKKSGAPQQLLDELASYIRQVKGERDPASFNPVVNAAANLAEKISNTVKKNQVIGNISSIVSQTLNIPLAVADVGVKPTIQGIFNFPKNIKTIESLPFVKERSFSYPLQMISGTKDKAIKIGGNALQAVDNATTRVIASLYMEKGKALGLSGKKLRRFVSDGLYGVMGGRGIGDASNLHYSRLGQFIAPFTVEVQAAVNKLGSFIDEKRAGAIAGYFLMTYGINKAWEKITGFSPLPDPIQAAIDMYKTATGEKETEHPFLRVIGRALGETMQFFPIAQNAVAFAYPIVYSIVKDEKGNPLLPSSREIFGSEDPTRFGSMNLYLPRTDGGIKGTLTDALFKYTPTGYGNQVRKTIEGILAGERGYTTSRSGRIVHEVPQDPLSRLKMAAFGQWATGSTKDFFSNEGNRSLTREQGEIYRSLPKEDRSRYMESVQRENQSKRLIDILTKKSNVNASSLRVPSDTADKKEKQAFSKAINDLLDRGIVPTEEQLSFALFSRQSADSPLLKDRYKVYQKAAKYFQSEEYSDEQKNAILQSARISPEQMEYYQLASEKEAVKLEGILSTIAPIEDNNERLLSLMKQRQVVAGKQVLTDKMIHYLYNNEYIGKEERDLLLALQYDEIKDQFYFKKRSASFGRGSSGSSFGGASAKAGSARQREIKREYLKILNQVYRIARVGNKKPLRKHAGQLAQIPSSGNKIIQDILRKRR